MDQKPTQKQLMTILFGGLGIIWTIGFAIAFYHMSHSGGDYYFEGRSAYENKHYESAVHRLQQEIRQHPDNSLAHYYLAMSLRQLDKSADAKDEFNKAYVSELKSNNCDMAFAEKCKKMSEEKVEQH